MPNQPKEEPNKLNVHSEKELGEQLSALQQANQELENFTYLLAHNLRQGLKNLVSLSSLLQTDHHQQLAEEGQYIVELIHENATKIDTLVADLLQYTKAAHANFARVPINLTILFEEAFQSEKLNYRDKNISFNVVAIPSVLGDKTALQEVCKNLISNALKFAAKQTHIKIDITAQSQNDQVIIKVKDNGVGFDDTQREKIFAAFKRLHKQSDFAGIGLGMSIVEQIITKHGGDIWAESPTASGAIFTIALPASKSMFKILSC